jgi:hypothetical protein
MFVFTWRKANIGFNSDRVRSSEIRLWRSFVSIKRMMDLIPSVGIDGLVLMLNGRQGPG